MFFRIIISILLISFIGCSGADKEKMIKRAEGERNIGEAYFNQGDYTAALQYLLKAERMNPDDHFVQNDLGLTYLAKKKYDRAIMRFKKAIEIKPSYSVAKNNLGTAYMTMGEWQKAIEVFEPLTNDLLYMTPYYPQFNMGWCYYNLKNYAEAEKLFQEAIESRETFFKAKRGLALVFMKTNRLDQAIAMIESAKENAPNFAVLYYDLGEIYFMQRDYQQALQNYQQFIKLDPFHEFAQDAKKKSDLITHVYLK